MCTQGIGAAVGQLDSPWDHLPPLSGLPVSPLCSLTSCLSSLPLTKLPSHSHPLLWEETKKGSSPSVSPWPWASDPRSFCSPALPSWCQHTDLCFPLVTSSGSKFTSLLPEASERVMGKVGWSMLGAEFHCRCYCNFRQLENCKLGPLSLRLCFSFYDPLEENEFPRLSSCL